MIHSDFQWVNFSTQFNDANQSETRHFQIDGNPVGHGYLLIQAFEVDLNPNHRIFINGQSLPSFDIPLEDNARWNLWMDHIPPGLLQSGDNLITIRRVGGVDNFFVGNVAIHWREQDN